MADDLPEKEPKIRRLEAWNFKRFPHLEGEFSNFIGVVGANASGKSSLVSALTFLRDIAMEGLSNAVSIHGGIDYVRNLRTGPTEDLGFKIDAEIDTFAVASLTPPAGSETNKERGLALHLTSMSYEFALYVGPRGPAYSVAKDRLILEGHLHEQPEGPKTRKKLLGKPQLGKAIGPTKLEYSVQSKKLSWKFSFPGGYTEGPNVSKAIQSLLGATGQKKPRIAGLMQIG